VNRIPIQNEISAEDLMGERGPLAQPRKAVRVAFPIRVRRPAP
jgi:hypothetical protein